MNRVLVMTAAACLAFSSIAGAQSGTRSAQNTLVVTTAWLAQHLHDPDLVIVQVDDHDAYTAGHIPGARYVDDKDFAIISGSNGLSYEMPSPSALHDTLATLGISNTSHVIVYTQQQWARSTRFVLTLDYAGLDHVSWLDGGLDGWKAAGQPVRTDVPTQRPGTLAPLSLRPIIADAAFVQSHEHTSGFAIVDGRATVYYDGTREGGASGHLKAGHIPGAHSIPYESLLTGEMTLKSPDELAAMFAKAGIQPGDTVVGYCHIGIQATAALFVARLLGHPVMLYDGSFEDWSRRDLPVEKPSARK